jgi:hypothetical protein
MIVALLGLFVGLGGVGIAANGQSLILGSTSNAATAQTALSAPVNAPAVRITNTNTGTDATPLSLVAASGHPALKVSSAAKVASLNADQLDSHDSSYFLPKTGKAADADKLDGIDSSGFTQGGGTFYSGHADRVPVNSQAALLTMPALTVSYSCLDGNAGIEMTYASLNIVEQADGGAPYFMGPNISGGSIGGSGATSVYLLASRPQTKFGQSAVLDDLRVTAAWDADTSTCSFQAVGESFG